ncbi:hypothetical protein IAD21_00676 [Abditibacteriota bacterium]|nr:hypothetical protein IAD21_00676 [Abditibacteriota bacterium]
MLGWGHDLGFGGVALTRHFVPPSPALREKDELKQTGLVQIWLLLTCISRSFSRNAGEGGTKCRVRAGAKGWGADVG